MVSSGFAGFADFPISGPRFFSSMLRPEKGPVGCKIKFKSGQNPPPPTSAFGEEVARGRGKMCKAPRRLNSDVDACERDGFRVGSSSKMGCRRNALISNSTDARKKVRVGRTFFGVAEIGRIAGFIEWSAEKW